MKYLLANKANFHLRFILLLGGLIFLNACRDVEEVDASNIFTPEYSFFVAGHTYRTPTEIALNVWAEDELGMHLPFVNQIPTLNHYPLMELGVLTGDVVYKPLRLNWEIALEEIDQFSMPIHIASGNHDRGPVFDSLFESYYSFLHRNDLFIILSPTNWNIEGDQKDFLFETINNHKSQVNNIFIFCHELIWWAPDNAFQNVKINHAPQYPGSTNYWEDLHPYFASHSNNIVLFAGDLGAKSSVTPYMYYKENNVTLIGSGMGSNVNDNIIIVAVDAEGKLNYKLLGINAKIPYKLAELEEYILP